MLKLLERLCFVLGGTLMAACTIAYVDRAAQRSAAIDTFHEVREKIVSPEARSNWSESRRTSYEAAMTLEAGETVAVLRIDALGIEVPVFDSTDEVALNRGAGHIAGSTPPGGEGNVAIAGHRDGFFRNLKDIEPGMSIRLLSLDGWQEFEVIELAIVDPLDVGVLSLEGEPRITLVTCYPFYFIGPAPDRFIVSARLAKPSSGATLAAGPASAGSTSGEFQ